MDILDKEGKSLQGSESTSGTSRLEIGKSVLLQEGVTYFFVTVSTMPSNGVLVRAEKEVDTVWITSMDGAKSNPVYGLKEYGTWDEKGNYDFQPYQYLIDNWILSVEYTDESYEEISLLDERVEFSYQVVNTQWGRRIEVPFTFLGYTRTRIIEVHSLEEYLGGEAVALGEVHSFFTRSDIKPHLGILHIEETGEYRISMLAGNGTWYVMDEEAKRQALLSDVGAMVAELEGGKTYYLLYEPKEETEEKVSLFVEPERKVVSFTGKLTRKEPFLKGEVALGSWEGDTFTINTSLLLSYLSCEIEYADGGRETLSGTDERLKVDLGDMTFDGENTFMVSFREEQVAVPYYLYEVKEGYKSYPLLALDTPCPIRYRGEGTGRLSFTAPEDGTYYLYSKGEESTGLTLYDEEGKPKYVIRDSQINGKGFLFSWQMTKGQVIYLDTYPLSQIERVSSFCQQEKPRRERSHHPPQTRKGAGEKCSRRHYGDLEKGRRG